MTNDLFPAFEFLSLSQLGQFFGASSHEVGRWLVNIGLRTPQYQPTERAKAAGLTKRCDPGTGINAFYTCGKDKVVALLEKAGHPRKLLEVPPLIAESKAPSLVGPFKVCCNGDDGYSISDSQGITWGWIRGEEITRKLIRLLNLAYECGKLG